MLDPEMPDQKLRLLMGELSAGEVRTARAAIRLANSHIEPRTENGTGAQEDDGSVLRQMHNAEIKILKDRVKEIELQNKTLRKQIGMVLRNPERYKQSSCYNKKTFYSPQEANRVTEKFGGKRYKCYLCDCYHITSKE